MMMRARWYTTIILIYKQLIIFFEKKIKCTRVHSTNMLRCILYYFIIFYFTPLRNGNEGLHFTAQPFNYDLYKHQYYSVMCVII